MRKAALALLAAFLMTTLLLTACTGATVNQPETGTSGGSSDSAAISSAAETSAVDEVQPTGTETAGTNEQAAANTADQTGDGSALTDINSENVEIFQDKSFWVNLDSWGLVWFVSAGYEEDSLKKARFYLVNKENRILYRFPDFSGNSWPMLDSVGTVSVKDVDGDGLKDIIIIADYITGMGENGTVPFPACSVYFQRDKAFVCLPDLDAKLNEKGQNENIETILKYIWDNDISFGNGEKSGAGGHNTSAVINSINSFTKYIETHFKYLKSKELELGSGPSQGGYITGYYEDERLIYTNAAVYSEFESIEYQIYHVDNSTTYIQRTDTVYDGSTYNEDAKISKETKKEFVIKDDIIYELVNDVFKLAENTDFMDDINNYENRLK